MAIEYFEIDTTILRQSITDFEQRLSDMRVKLNGLTEKMTELDSMWDGPASETFHTQFIKDCAAFQEICEVLGDFIDSAKYAAKEYDICEYKVKEAVNAIQV